MGTVPWNSVLKLSCPLASLKQCPQSVLSHSTPEMVSPTCPVSPLKWCPHPPVEAASTAGHRQGQGRSQPPQCLPSQTSEQGVTAFPTPPQNLVSRPCRGSSGAGSVGWRVQPRFTWNSLENESPRPEQCPSTVRWGCLVGPRSQQQGFWASTEQCCPPPKLPPRLTSIPLG